MSSVGFLNSRSGAGPSESLSQSTKAPTEKFKKYSYSLTLPGRQRGEFFIRNFENIGTMFSLVSKSLKTNHGLCEIDFPSFESDHTYVTDEMVLARIKSYEDSPHGQNFQFELSQHSNRTIYIKPKPIKTEVFEDGKVRNTFKNGVIEEFKITQEPDCYGSRLFSDGSKECGWFSKSDGKFLRGYKKNIDKSIKFCNPTPLLKYSEGRSWKNVTFSVIELEGKLVTLKESYVAIKKGSKICHKKKEEVLDLESLFHVCQRVKNRFGKSLKPILSHKSFADQKEKFIQKALTADASGRLRLFLLSDAAIIDVIKELSKIKDFDILTVVDPKTKRNLFIQSVIWEPAILADKQLLDYLLELFPKSYKQIGASVIIQFIKSDHSGVDSRKCLQKLILIMEQEGGKQNLFYGLLRQVVAAKGPILGYKQEFKKLSEDQRQLLYQVAYTQNNPFIHEPTDQPILPDQYSINFMWINRQRMSSTQQYLIKSKEDFDKKFVQPLSKWAKINVGSTLNIWFDSSMAIKEAVERSKKALLDQLKGMKHAQIKFRDIRSIKTVNDNPFVFMDNMPIYFRVDLLKAIVPDYLLKTEKSQFAVMSDIDVTAQSSEQLFDKRTVQSLNDCGWVMTKGGPNLHRYENSFMIMNGKNNPFIDSHRKVIIDLNIQMADEKPYMIKEQQVYDTYPAMLIHLLAKKGSHGKLELRTLNGENGLIVDDPDEVLSSFRYDRWHQGPISLENPCRDSMPMKPVKCPPSHFVL